MKQETKQKSCRCMICGSRQFLLREEEIVLCARCVDALAEALQDKLPQRDTVKKHKEGIEKPLLLW